MEAIDKPFLTLREALKLSNNNAFVNASHKCGFEKIQSVLAKTFNESEANFVPASILGATVKGITLYELVCAYHKYFVDSVETSFKTECISVLEEIALGKFGEDLPGVFLKTGTTNHNRERYAIVGMAKILFGFLRQGNPIDDYTKDGNFLASVMGFLKRIGKKMYKWD